MGSLRPLNVVGCADVTGSLRRVGNVHIHLEPLMPRLNPTFSGGVHVFWGGVGMAEAHGGAGRHRVTPLPPGPGHGTHQQEPQRVDGSAMHVLVSPHRFDRGRSPVIGSGGVAGTSLLKGATKW